MKRYPGSALSIPFYRFTMQGTLKMPLVSLLMLNTVAGAVWHQYYLSRQTRTNKRNVKIIPSATAEKSHHPCCLAHQARHMSK